MQVGPVRLRVDEACVHCRGIEANPQSAEYDFELQQALDDMMKSRGYRGAPHNKSAKVMGVLARHTRRASLGRAIRCGLIKSCTIRSSRRSI